MLLLTTPQYNPVFHTVVSVDTSGMIEYWSADPEYGHPEAVNWDMKLDTDLYLFVKVCG